jgi:hypothetical protein
MKNSKNFFGKKIKKIKKVFFKKVFEKSFAAPHY